MPFGHCFEMLQRLMTEHDFSLIAEGFREIVI